MNVKGIIESLDEPANETKLLVIDQSGGATYFWRDDHRSQGSAERWFRPAPPLHGALGVTWEEVVRNAFSVWGLSSKPLAVFKER